VSAIRAFAGDAPDKTTNRIHRWFEDMGAFILGASALFVVGSLFLFAAIQSPSMLQWTGTAVRSVENGGIAYYSFHGQNYTLDVTSPLLQTGTVYLDPADPSNAMFSNPLTRWTDIATIGGPYAASVLLLTAGFARRSRRRRLKRRGPGRSFGSGLDQAALGRLRDRQRDVDSRRGGRPDQHDSDS
jgi:hypothetical protein